MKPPPFGYAAPTSLAKQSAARRARRRGNPGARRRAEPRAADELPARATPVPGRPAPRRALRSVRTDGDLVIGAMARQSDASGRRRWPWAPRWWPRRWVRRAPADPQQRHRGRQHRARRPGRRAARGRARPGRGDDRRRPAGRAAVPAAEFFRGPFTTALGPARSSPRSASRGAAGARVRRVRPHPRQLRARRRGRARRPDDGRVARAASRSAASGRPRCARPPPSRPWSGRPPTRGRRRGGGRGRRRAAPRRRPARQRRDPIDIARAFLRAASSWRLPRPGPEVTEMAERHGSR